MSGFELLSVVRTRFQVSTMYPVLERGIQTGATSALARELRNGDSLTSFCAASISSKWKFGLFSRKASQTASFGTVTAVYSPLIGNHSDQWPGVPTFVLCGGTKTGYVY